MSERVNNFTRGFRTTLAHADALLGQEVEFTDNDPAAVSGVESMLSGMKSTAMLVKNANATVPAPGTAVIWGSPGTTVNGNAGADAAAAGIVDPSLITGPVQGEKFLLFIYGPVKCLTTAVNLAAGAKVKTAATGRVVLNAAAAVADLVGGVGRNIDATTGSVEQLARVFVDLRHNK